MMPENHRKQTSRVILSIPLTLDLKAEPGVRGRGRSATMRGTCCFRRMKSRAPRNNRKDLQALAVFLARLGATEGVRRLIGPGTACAAWRFSDYTGDGGGHMQACTDVAEIEALLTKALGIGER